MTNVLRPPTELAHSALEVQREGSERLLLIVLPAPITERFKHHEGIIAEQHDHVTVLFADIVGVHREVGEHGSRRDPTDRTDGRRASRLFLYARGTIDVKCKGPMDTFLLEREA